MAKGNRHTHAPAVQSETPADDTPETPVIVETGKDAIKRFHPTFDEAKAYVEKLNAKIEADGKGKGKDGKDLKGGYGVYAVALAGKSLIVVGKGPTTVTAAASVEFGLSCEKLTGRGAAKKPTPELYLSMLDDSEFEILASSVEERRNNRSK